MNRLAFFIAWRYLFSKKSTNAINIISGISVLGFLVGSFALITILSALNGFESLVGNMLQEFDPELKVVSVNGKSFSANNDNVLSLNELEGVENSVGIIEEHAVIEHNNQYGVVTLKGVPPEFAKYRNTEGMMAAGTFDLQLQGMPAGVFGAGIAMKLGLHPSAIQFCNVFLPSRNGDLSALNPAASLQQEKLAVAGIFLLQEEIDNKYVFVPRSSLERMLDYQNRYSYLEIIPEIDADKLALKTRIQRHLGSNFKVLDRYEQNESIYRIFKSEKLATYIILAFVLLLSAFNTTGSVSMIVLEKQADTEVLRSMGADNGMIRRVFFTLGMIISWIGGMIGILAGLLLAWSQQRWGWLKIENSVVEAYPVQVIWTDVLLVLITVCVLGFFTAGIPAWRSVQNGPVRMNQLRRLK